jgi:hypothetical protein
MCPKSKAGRYECNLAAVNVRIVHLSIHPLVPIASSRQCPNAPNNVIRSQTLLRGARSGVAKPNPPPSRSLYRHLRLQLAELCLLVLLVLRHLPGAQLPVAHRRQPVHVPGHGQRTRSEHLRRERLLLHALELVLQVRLVDRLPDRRVRDRRRDFLAEGVLLAELVPGNVIMLAIPTTREWEERGHTSWRPPYRWLARRGSASWPRQRSSSRSESLG